MISINHRAMKFVTGVSHSLNRQKIQMLLQFILMVAVSYGKHFLIQTYGNVFNETGQDYSGRGDSVPRTPGFDPKTGTPPDFG